MKLLEGQTVIITGASRGIGKGIAEVFAQQGANIAFTYRSSDEKAKQLEKELSANGCKAKGYKSDASDFVAAQQLASDVLEEFGSIDVLVNNAGTNIPEPFEKIKQKSMNYLVDLNLKAAFNVAQLVVKKMLKNKKRPGSIINMSSQLGHVGMGGRNVYNMTKFGIEGLTKGMGVELAKKNIRVNTVAPTFVETPMVKNFFKNKKFKKLALGNIPMGKAATESDVATTVCFLASSASSMITGTSIIIDGGWTAQ